MLEIFDFIAWASRLNISGIAQNVINNIRNSEPSRRVKSSKGAVIGTFPSRKMGVTIQFESHKNELPFIHELEHDPDVLEFYDQPPPFKLEYKSLKGRNLAHSHTPDFFVVHNDHAAWIECKTETELLNLSVKQPNRFMRDGFGVWRCPPGEKYARQFGLKYVVRSDKEINWNFQRNIEFLDDYYGAQTFDISEDIKQSVIALIKNEFGITLEGLFEKVSGEINRDHIFFLIALSEIYVDLYSQPLTDSAKVKVYIDKESALAYSNVAQFPSDQSSQTIHTVEISVGNQIIWDKKIWRIANIGNSSIYLIDESSSCSEIPVKIFEELVRHENIQGVHTNEFYLMTDLAKERLAAASQEDIATANERHRILMEHFQGFALSKKLSKKTIGRWSSSFHQAETVYGCGYVGLLPIPRPGNRTERLSHQTIEARDKFISNEFENLKQKRKFEVYAAFCAYCEERNIEPSSYKNLSDAIKKRPQYEQAFKRKGQRAAYEKQPFYYTLEEDTPRHGERPLHIAHIDHTELDTELKDSVTGVNYGRPWLTLLIDAYSRLILAMYLTFDKPSYRSCLMVLRECVRRHGRFPQILVTDGGKEFSGIYFEMLLAAVGCTKKTRPPAEARFGSVIERIFCTTNTQFVHNLQGNTQIMKNVRQVTKHVNPKNQALWHLSKCYELAQKYCYEVYPSLKHSTLGQTPADMFAIGNQIAGERKHKIIPYTEDFKILTLPAVKKNGGKAKVVPGKGVKVSNIYYWTPTFTSPDVEGFRVPVRHDPFDVGHVYAFVKKHWVECFSEHYSTLKGCSEKLIMIASAELRRRAKLTKEDINLNASKLAVFLKSIDSEEIILKQKGFDRELSPILTTINGNTTHNINGSILSPADEVSDVTSADPITEDYSSEDTTYDEF